MAKVLMNFQVEEEQKQAYEEAAAKVGMKVSAWLRELADRECDPMAAPKVAPMVAPPSPTKAVTKAATKSVMVQKNGSDVTVSADGTIPARGGFAVLFAKKDKG